MAEINVLLKLKNLLGAVINPRKEDGHGSAPATPTHVNVTASALPSGAATEATLSVVRDLLQRQREFDESLWTDDAGGYYLRRVVVDESVTPPTFTITWTDQSGGASGGPGAGARPVSVLDREIITRYFIATAAGAGYSSGDYLARALVIDASQVPPAVDAAIWVNVTTGATIGTPTAGTFEESTEIVGLKNALGAAINPATEDTMSARHNPAATLLNLLPSSTGQKSLRLKGHGANQQFSYNVRAATSATPDQATHEVVRQRRVGPSSALVATYSRSGSTVTVTTPSAHNLETNDLIYHTGAADTGLNGYAKATVTGAMTYTFTTGASGATTGAIAVQPVGDEFRYRTGVALTALESDW